MKRLVSIYNHSHNIVCALFFFKVSKAALCKTLIAVYTLLEVLANDIQGVA